jgi:uncharacterized protein (TIGR03382 family)
VCRASVVTTTTCTILDNAGSALAAQTNPTSCSVSYDNRGSTGVMNGTIPPAFGTAVASISGTFSGTSLSFTGLANGDTIGAATAQASFSETASLLLDTPGPFRSGFITFTRLDPFSPGPPTGQVAQVNVGSYTASCSASGCTGDLRARPGLASFTLPFTLGEEYLFSDTFSGLVSVNAPGSIERTAGGTVDFSYFLTDSAGNVVEPFQATAAPEPTSATLCVLGVSLLALRTRRRRAN